MRLCARSLSHYLSVTRELKCPICVCGPSGSTHHQVHDTVLLFRLLECCPGKSVAVKDLWRVFSDKAVVTERDAKPGTRQRFGKALLTLHSLGLFIPCGSNKQFGWRLRKRHFGRVWMKEPDEVRRDRHERSDETIQQTLESTLPDSEIPEAAPRAPPVRDFMTVTAELALSALMKNRPVLKRSSPPRKRRRGVGVGDCVCICVWCRRADPCASVSVCCVRGTTHAHSCTLLRFRVSVYARQRAAAHDVLFRARIYWPTPSVSRGDVGSRQCFWTFGAHRPG